MSFKPAYKLSPSSINLMLKCPRCFWLQLVKKEKRPSTPFPSLPSGMDKVLKEHFDRFMEKGKLPPELREQECAKEGCSLFDDKEKLETWGDNFKGIEYLDKKCKQKLWWSCCTEQHQFIYLPTDTDIFFHFSYRHDHLHYDLLGY